MKHLEGFLNEIKTSKNMKITLDVKSVDLVIRKGAEDSLTLTLNTPFKTHASSEGSTIEVRTQHKHGEEWCRKVLKVEPNIIDTTKF